MSLSYESVDEGIINLRPDGKFETFEINLGSFTGKTISGDFAKKVSILKKMAPIHTKFSFEVKHSNNNQLFVEVTAPSSEEILLHHLYNMREGKTADVEAIQKYLGLAPSTSEDETIIARNRQRTERAEFKIILRSEDDDPGFSASKTGSLISVCRTDANTETSASNHKSSAASACPPQRAIDEVPFRLFEIEQSCWDREELDLLNEAGRQEERKLRNKEIELELMKQEPLISECERMKQETYMRKLLESEREKLAWQQASQMREAGRLQLEESKLRIKEAKLELVWQEQLRSERMKQDACS